MGGALFRRSHESHDARQGNAVRQARWRVVALVRRLRCSAQTYGARSRVERWPRASALKAQGGVLPPALLSRAESATS